MVSWVAAFHSPPCAHLVMHGHVQRGLRWEWGSRSTRFLLEIADDLEQRFVLYGDIARVTLGGVWPSVVQWLIVIGQIGICCAYLIFLTEFASIQAGHFGLQMSRLGFLLLTTIAIIPLTMVSNMHYFHQASTFGFTVGLAAILITLANTVYFYFHESREMYLEAPFKFAGTFTFVGVGIITFEGIMTVLPIRDSMANMKVRLQQISIFSQDFQKVFGWSVSTNFVLCLSMFELTILLLPQPQEVFLFNTQDFLLQLVASSLYAISLLLCYPLQIFVALQILDESLEQRRYRQVSDQDILHSQTGSHSDDQVFTSDLGSIFQRLLLTVVIYMVAYFVPSIVQILNLLGNVIGSLLQYVFPVIFHMAHFRGAPQSPPYFRYIVVLLFSALALIFGPIEFIRNLNKQS